MKTESAALLITAIALFLTGCSPPEDNQPLAELVRDDLITAQGKTTSADKLLEADYLLLYFSAHWCPPCRAFTPGLVHFYNTHKGGQHFNVLFISADRSSSDMQTYMRETKMPWLAVKHRSPDANALSDRYSGSGIPCLVLINNKGAVLADSYKGRRYIGPQSVLDQFEKLLAARYPQYPELEDNKKPILKPASKPDKNQPRLEYFSQTYKINGFGQRSGRQLAFINGELKETGTELESGVIVFAITDNYVELFSNGERYRLYPEK